MARSVEQDTRLPWSVLPRGGRAALVLVALAAGPACAAADAASAERVRVVADRLANPRGLAFGPDGRLYVAEAGRGGHGRCIAAPAVEGGRACSGATGAIARVDVRSGRTRRIVRRLPSLASRAGDPPGAAAIGPQDVSFRGRRAYFTVGLAAEPAARARLGGRGRRFAALYRIGRGGRPVRVADLGAYEAAHDPDRGRAGSGTETNPYALDATAPGPILVTDASANDLLAVTPGGRVSTVVVFPFDLVPAATAVPLPPGVTQIARPPVPTGIARGPGDEAYVGQLTGFPSRRGAARVFRVAGDPPQTTEYASGFTAVVDVARGPDGSLYVLQYSTRGPAGPPRPGRLIRLAPDGRRTELARRRLIEPTGVALGPDGAVYVADQGTSPTNGEIVRIEAG